MGKLIEAIRPDTFNSRILLARIILFRYLLDGASIEANLTVKGSRSKLGCPSRLLEDF